MEQREKLIELIIESVHGLARNWAEVIADHLLANGVVVLPCRCEECESFSKGMCDNEHVGAMVFRMNRKATDFCSYGKRKGGEN